VKRPRSTIYSSHVYKTAVTSTISRHVYNSHGCELYSVAFSRHSTGCRFTILYISRIDPRTPGSPYRFARKTPGWPYICVAESSRTPYGRNKEFYIGMISAFIPILPIFPPKTFFAKTPTVILSC